MKDISNGEIIHNASKMIELMPTLKMILINQDNDGSQEAEKIIKEMDAANGSMYAAQYGGLPHGGDRYSLFEPDKVIVEVGFNMKSSFTGWIRILRSEVFDVASRIILRSMKEVVKGDLKKLLGVLPDVGLRDSESNKLKRILHDL